MYRLFNKKTLGFSLLETLLVISLFAVISGFSIPAYISFQRRNDLDLSVQKTISTLRRGQTMAKNQEGDSGWGVRLAGNSVTLFKGNDFVLRDTSFDESFIFPSTINFSSNQDIIWNKFSGTPTSTYSATLTNGQGESGIININEKGAISY